MAEETNVETQKRPGFITVLCILTFIGSGLGILGGILMLVGSGMLAGSSFGSLLGAAAGGGALYGGLILAGNLACLFGAIQMWKLKKMGFYIYIAGSLIGIIAPIAIGAGFNVGSVIFPVAFMVMYGINLKHMA